MPKNRINKKSLSTYNFNDDKKVSIVEYNKKLVLENKKNLSEIATYKQNDKNDLYNYPLNLNNKNNYKKQNILSIKLTNENYLCLDKTQSIEKSFPEISNKLDEEKKIVSNQVIKCPRRKNKKSNYTKDEKTSKGSCNSITYEMISTNKLENLFKKFNNSSKENLNEIKDNQKISTNNDYQFREKPPPETKDNESSLILLKPSVNFERQIGKNETTKVIQPDIIKRTKKEQKMVEGTWYNKILDENTLDDVPSDWDENRRPKRKKKPTKNFAMEYDSLII
ncbi:Hypothetical protein SRAE_2000390600 [Strongyloides ratti]|uniref:Uncharacterized protein n=1 Tax=Strongyloides ratti TaxID=34506 RepID=A0A090LHJ3_STRRB|nr:Hypothetical protein SRAE_2000390600 [Strongyloides ratti]CEF69256.1 Hypothetical protein SRAE_2000390600 [Strongyloides ratti]